MYRSTPSLAGSKSTLNSTTSGSRTTLNNTQYGSRSALNKTTTEKNCGLGTLKLVLVLINDNIEDTDLERKLKLDDFNHLTSDQMLKIVTFLMRTVIGEKQVYMPGRVLTLLSTFALFTRKLSFYACHVNYTH